MAEQIIDALLVTLGLDSSGYVKGQKEATASLKKTGDQATSTAKEMQARGAQAAEFFSKVRNEALGLLTVLVGGRGLAALVSDSVTSLSALGRTAHDIGLAVPQLAALRNMISASGGDADAATASFQGLAQAMASARTYGPSAGLAAFLGRIGASVSDPVDVVYSKFNQWAQGKNPEDVITVGGQGGLDIGTIREAEKPVAEFQKDYADALKRGVPTPEMTKNMQDLQTAFRETEQAADNLVNSGLNKIAPLLTHILNGITAFIEANPQAATDIGLAATVGTGALGLAAFRFVLGGGKGGGTALSATEAAGGAVQNLGGFGGGLLNGIPLTFGMNWLVDHPLLPRKPGESIGAQIDRSSGYTAMQSGGDAKARQAYDYFTSQGWTHAQAAAIAGNLRGESGFDPTQVGDSGQAVGIEQWHPDRVAAIKAGTGIDVRTAAYADQLKAVQWELTHTEKVAGDDLKTKSDYSTATWALVHGYSRSKWQMKDQFIRSQYAGYYDQKFPSTPAANNNSNSMSVGQIVINTQATDAKGISRDLDAELKKYSYTAMANQGIN